MLVQIGHEQNTSQQGILFSLHHLVSYFFLTNSQMEPPLPVIMRKMYQFIEENEHDSSIDELLLLASTFANSTNADASKWLKCAATKVLATTSMLLTNKTSEG